MALTQKKLRSRLGRVRALVAARNANLLLSSYLADIRRYAFNSGAVRTGGPELLETLIVMDYHRIEKGLTLSDPRPWFGKDVILRLCANLSALTALSDHDEYVVAGAVGALDAYEEEFRRTTGDEPAWWATASEQLTRVRAREVASEQRGGVEPLHAGFTQQNFEHERFLPFASLARNRSSVRNFTEDLVGVETIRACVEIAQSSPSVCNRQASRVRLVERGPKMDELLALQNGNRGFGNTASHIALITADLHAFVSPGERNQPFIDGGLFAMSFLYALEERLVGTCCLNWSTTSKQDKKLRTAAAIPDHEVILMMIAIGIPGANGVVTKSPKRRLDRTHLVSEYESRAK